MTESTTTGNAAAVAPAQRIAPFRESIWLVVDAMFERHPDMIFFGNGAKIEAADVAALHPAEPQARGGREAREIRRHATIKEGDGLVQSGLRGGWRAGWMATSR